MWQTIKNANFPANPATPSVACPPAPGGTLSYAEARRFTESLCAELLTEDYGIQTIAEVSPPKWHLAHTSWFFETFLLLPYLSDYRPFQPAYKYLFNSYYEALGGFHPRLQRGWLSRPTVEEIYAYRRYVDDHMAELLARPPVTQANEIQARTRLGIHHEQQHQELLLMDIKHIFAVNPLRPAYRRLDVLPSVASPLSWTDFAGGIQCHGHAGDSFAFDNEMPRHQVLTQDFQLADRPVSNGEYLEFVEAGGYAEAHHWLSDGWKTVQREQWNAPLYWEHLDGHWWQMGLGGLLPLDPHAPVCHLSYYEADAYARFRDARLPTEFEWEQAARGRAIIGNLCERGLWQPYGAALNDIPAQLFGDVWEWTQSAYLPYPGYHAADGAIGEYNGKFMSSQMVLRGGSCMTPISHLRASYRNFFYPADRWQCAGLRLARDA